MHGVYRIERETVVGDIGIVAEIDIEGLLRDQNPLRIAMERADEILAQGGVWKVWIIHDNGWDSRVHGQRTAGREWRGREVAAMREP